MSPTNRDGRRFTGPHWWEITEHGFTFRSREDFEPFGRIALPDHDPTGRPVWRDGQNHLEYQIESALWYVAHGLNAEADGAQLSILEMHCQNRNVIQTDGARILDAALAAAVPKSTAAVAIAACGAVWTWTKDGDRTFPYVRFA